jgi:hypothetical protein
MNYSEDTPDPRLTHLRGLVATVEREVQTQLPEGPLRVAWDDLVKALALGPEPPLRPCPACARAVPVDASRCRYCWARWET